MISRVEHFWGSAKITLQMIWWDEQFILLSWHYLKKKKKKYVFRCALYFGTIHVAHPLKVMQYGQGQVQALKHAKMPIIVQVFGPTFFIEKCKADWKKKKSTRV